MRFANGRRPSEAARTAVEFLRACVRIDTRSLALFRIVVAGLVLADVFLRARNFAHFYTDAGVVPRSLAREAAPVDVTTVYHLSSDPTAIAALFVLNALIALQLLVGYRTRIATILAFVFVVSLDLRNPLVLSYADVLFAWLLLWAIFLPLGERWSIDAVHADRPPRPSVVSIGSALILLQMITMYVVNGYHKTSSELWRTGEAAPLVLGLDDMTFLLGDVVRTVPSLLRYGGLAWFVMLLCSWLLLLARGRVRTLLVGAFVGSHLSFAVTVRIGAFAYVAIAGLLLFLRAPFWDDLRALARRLEIESVVETTVRPTLIAVASSVPRSDPGLETPGWFPENPSRSARSVVVVAFVAIALVSTLSAGGLVGDDVRGVEEVESATAAFVDHQTEWSIFAPHPRTTDRYHVFAAKTEGGELVDVYNDRELTYERPSDQLQTQYETYRERFYMTNVAASEPPDAPVLLAEHHCRTWRSDDGDRITHVELYQIREDVTLETIDAPDERERESVLIHRHGCGDREPTEVDSPPF
ncbi:HTTM domain-containing protein [Natrarchaeobius oligotrophus]|uniref:HTTM domain-containing protein n=1 Tax=Natrarchaeobius chitinivorans TaxID=1679083 RepID=A0A3N6MQI1_NATCH|nr:HTTM domain-containing protein [Natrarchaeobius chitinivorans]RQG99930.1 HTTM domain-containing protein [Natrarchaeobius chitinivorans]